MATPHRHRAHAKPLSSHFSFGAWALPVFVAAAIVLGGASSAGVIPNLLLQLLAIGLIWYVGIAVKPRVFEPAEKRLLILGALLVVVVLLQLVPLPPKLWTAFAGRAPVADAFRLLGAPLPWLPMSLNPAGTVTSLLGGTIMLAAFLLTYKASDESVSRFAWAVVLIAAVSIGVGFAQLESGAQSPLYLYSNTNRGQPVGFFANSNHLATLELMAMPLLAAMAARRRADGQLEGQAGHVVVFSTLGVVLLLGLVLNGSLAGLTLLLPTLIGCFLLFRGGRSRRIALIGFGVAVVLVGVFVLLALNSPIVAGYAATSLDVGPTSRLSFIGHTLDAIRTYFPLGSGLGTFSTVYPAFEDPASVTGVFVNHVHNDYLELVLESGIFGIVIVLLFLAWWAWRVTAIWRDRESGPILRAATVVTAIVIAHSLVDYPIRTAAIAAIFTASCAIMARPFRVRAVPQVTTEAAPTAKHLSA